MVRRLTFFVSDAVLGDTGWKIRGEVGLGPIEVGDEFVAVHHQDDNTEDKSTLRVVGLDTASMVVAGGIDLDLRKDDILIWETNKRS